MTASNEMKASGRIERRRPKSEIYFAVLFIVVFGGLQFGYSANRGGAIERFLIDTATVRPSAAAIDFLSPSENVRAIGHRLVSTHAALSVLNGCEGTETMFLLIAAIVAFHAPWKQKYKGMFQGVLLVYGLNQLRIVSLFFTARYNRSFFDMLHGYVAPTLIIVFGCLYFLWWARQSLQHA